MQNRWRIYCTKTCWLDWRSEDGARKKSIKQLNRVSISVSLGFGLGLVLGLGLVSGLVLGLVLGLMPSSDIVLKSTVLSSSCVPDMLISCTAFRIGRQNSSVEVLNSLCALSCRYDWLETVLANFYAVLFARDNRFPAFSRNNLRDFAGCYPNMTTLRSGVRMPSQIRLSSVDWNVRAPYLAGWNFPQCFYAILYPSYLLTSMQNLTEIVLGKLLSRGLNVRGVAKYNDFKHVEG